MFTPVAGTQGVGGELPTIGLGFFVYNEESQPLLVSHSGGNRGWRARFVAAPESGDGLVVLTNSDDGNRLIEALVCSWGRHQLDLDVPGAC